MLRKFAYALGLVGCSFLIAGCDGAASKANSAAKDAKDAAKDAKDAAKEAGGAAKDAIAKPVTDMYPKIEEKIKGLSGDAMTKATEKFAAVKKLVTDFMASPTDKMGEIGDKLKAAFAELKTMVGL